MFIGRTTWSKATAFTQPKKAFYNFLSTVNYVTQHNAQSKQINLQQIQDIIRSHAMNTHQVILGDLL